MPPGNPDLTEPTPAKAGVFPAARGSSSPAGAWGNPVDINSLPIKFGEIPDPQTVNLIDDAWRHFARVHNHVVELAIATNMLIAKSHPCVFAMHDVMLSNALAVEAHDLAGRYFARINELLAIELDAGKIRPRDLFEYQLHGPYAAEGGRL